MAIDDKFVKVYSEVLDKEFKISSPLEDICPLDDLPIGYDMEVAKYQYFCVGCDNTYGWGSPGDQQFVVDQARRHAQSMKSKYDAGEIKVKKVEKYNRILKRAEKIGFIKNHSE